MKNDKSSNENIREFDSNNVDNFEENNLKISENDEIEKEDILNKKIEIAKTINDNEISKKISLGNTFISSNTKELDVNNVNELIKDATTKMLSIKMAEKQPTQIVNTEEIRNEEFDKTQKIDLSSHNSIQDTVVAEENLNSLPQNTIVLNNNEKNELSKENIKRVLDAIILILCSSEDECFKRFIENNMENISSIISFKTCKGKEVPIDIKPEDSTDIDLGITRSMELVYQFISLEDDIEVKDSEYVDRTVEENLENIGEPEFEVVKEEKELLTEDVLDKYKKIIEEGRLVEERLLSIRERMSDEEKNMVDYAISCLIEIFDMFKKSEEYQAHKNNHNNTDIDFVEFILTYTKPLDIELLKDTLNCSNIFKIELILVTLMNIPVL